MLRALIVVAMMMSGCGGGVPLQDGCEIVSVVELPGECGARVKCGGARLEVHCVAGTCTCSGTGRFERWMQLTACDSGEVSAVSQGNDRCGWGVVR